MKRSYHVVACSKRGAAQTLAAFCRANGQVLLPLVELVTQARLAVDTMIEQISQQTLETILVRPRRRQRTQFGLGVLP